ncbi:MAG: DUF4142 domain-containing protein [Polyangiaceae bacterium]|nr:DUF4142 domain-containing protein [Polyangiaceae bacterium]
MRRGSSPLIVIIGLFAAATGCDKDGGNAASPQVGWGGTPAGEESAFMQAGPRIGYGQGSQPASAVLPAEQPSEPPPTSTERTDATLKLTDEQVLAVLDTSRLKQVEQAKIAIDRTKNKDIKAFAKAILDKNEDAKKKQRALELKLGILAQPSERSDIVILAAKQDVESLRALSLAEFDQKFLQVATEDLKQSTDFIENHAIPSVERSELKALLEEVRTGAAMQISDADAIADKLKEKVPESPAPKKRTAPIKPGASSKLLDPETTALR